MKMTKPIPHRNLILGNSLAALLAALLLILPLRLPAGETSAHNRDLPRHPLTLKDCIAIALGESPKLEGSRLDILAAGAEIRAAQDLLWPNLKGTVTGEAFSGSRIGRFGIVTATGPGGANGVGANKKVNLAGIGIGGLKLEYPAFKDGSIFGFNDAPAVELKRAQRNALAWTTHLTREDVIYRVTQVFVDTVSAQNRVEPIDRKVELLQRSVDIHREQQQKGLILPVDVEVVTKQLNGAQTLSKIIHQQAVAGALGLTKLLGLQSSAHINLNSTLPEPPAPPDAAQLFHTMLARHPSLQAQLANIEKAKQDYRLENFRLYPDVVLHGSAVYVTDLSTDAHLLIGGVTVDIPIWDFGAQLNTMRARRDTYHAEQARLGAVGNDLTSELARIYQEIYVETQRILTLQVEAGKLDRDLRVAQSQEQQGIGQPVTTIDAEAALIDKQEELEVHTSRRLLLYAELQKAMGGTWKWLP
jgi:outer membrane protein TolC